MTKHSTFYIACFICIFVTLLTAKAQVNPFAEQLQTKLDTYHEKCYKEKAYLLTDRYVYKPGEDLWFKGFIIAFPTEIDKIKSEDFFIRLINSHGEEVVFRRYPLSGCEAKGRISIPKSCIPGKYWLIAYSGWMRNGCPEEAFRKEILISKYFERRFQVDIGFDETIYFPGDTLNAVISVTDPSGKPLAATPFDYDIGTLDKKDTKGNGITDNQGKARIKTILPDLNKTLLLAIQIRNKKYSGKSTQTIPMAVKEPEITFYPEGGNLIAGITNNIVIKAVDANQQPCVVLGHIMNSRGKVLQPIHTSESGYADFEFVPPSDSCFLKITFPEGIDRKIPLPLALQTGFTVHYLKSNSDSAYFKITGTDSVKTKLPFAVVMNRNIMQTGYTEVNQSSIVGFSLMQVPKGILQFTLFSPQNQVLAERSVYVDGNEPGINVKMDRQVFHTRERISLILEYPEHLNDSKLAMSVSLKNLSSNSKSVAFENFIHSDPYATNDLLSKDALMNDQMIASDYKSIQWNEVLSDSCLKLGSVQNSLSGIVYDKKNNIAQHAKVRITHFPNFRLFETQSDENGQFGVDFGSDIIDFKFLNTEAYDAMGKVNLNAKIDYSYPARISEMLVNQSEENSIRQRMQDLLAYDEPDLVYVLRFGPGKFRKSQKDMKKKYDPYQYSNYTNVLSIIQDMQPFKLKNNRIVFLTNDRNRQDTSSLREEALIVVNGTVKGVDTSSLKDLVPSDITNIKISHSLMDVHKYTPMNFNGVIEITTIQGMYKYRQAEVQTGQQGILNTEKAFYSPDYAVESSYTADNRKTLYWNPDLEILQDKRMLITFYSSDVKGLYYGHIAGLDPSGNPVEAEFTFRVE